MTKTETIRPNDSVWVLPASEILEQLDSQGCTEKLQFMPEMLVYCGRRFTVRRFVNKICADLAPVQICAMPNAIVLDVERCSGAAHGGCQAGCQIMWHAKWLSKAEPSFADSSVSTNQLPTLIGEQFRCQATELVRQAEPLSIGKPSQYFDDLRVGRISVGQLVGFFVKSAAGKLGLRNVVVGKCKSTPVQNLDLQVGERVRVKSPESIALTLNSKGYNRGMWFDSEAMTQYCGREMLVSRRIERMINEKTGRMMQLKVPSIVLSEAACTGLHNRFCGRGSLFYWRECWLERL